MAPLPLLSQDDPDALTLKRRQCLRRSSLIRDEHMDIAGWAYKSRTDVTQFAGVRHHDDLLGLLEHLAIDQRLICFERRGATLGIEPRHAEKNFIHINIVEKSQRCISG